MSPKYVLLCVEGASVEALLDAAVPLLTRDVVWVPTHVVDVRGQRDLGLLRRGIPGAGPLSRGQQQAIDEATTERAHTLLRVAQAALTRRGLQQAPPQVRTGEPGREVCEVAASVHAHAVVLRASRRERPPTGPPSVGHTARFVLDHAPCPVLLLRGLP
jgi:nucleotide-binding universal stress UspA family protein